MPQNKSFEITMDKEKMMHQMCDDISRCFPNIICSDNQVKVAAYLLYKVSRFNDPFSIGYEQLFSEKMEIHTDVANYAKAIITESIWENLKSLIEKYSVEDFAYKILSETYANVAWGDVTTPDSIIRLANGILDVKKGDCIGDICCGLGTYIKKTVDDYPGVRIEGYDLNVECTVISRIKAEIMEEDIAIRLLDVFDLADESNTKYLKIFSNYPFGMRVRNLGAGTKYFNKLAKKEPSLSNTTSSDWIFNSLLVDLLEDNGRAVAVMTNGSTWNSIDIPMRRYFIEHGYIESVISLPAKMFLNSGIATTMIVLSKGNDAVRMVDASSLYHQGRRYNEFSDTDIEAILEALHTDSDISQLISQQMMAENEYNLSLVRYQKHEVQIKDGVPFCDIMKSITRGAPCNAAQLDAMSSPTVTNMQYLMLADIQDGIISKDLKYLKNIDDSLQKYCLKNRNLILSKNGYPYKIAVAEVNEGQQILANGNLFIIELDEDKVDPYYLKAFFEGDTGIALLKSITVGATIPNIGISALKGLSIPLPSIEVQHKLAQQYQTAQDEVKLLKMRLERTVDKARHIIDDYMKEV